MKNYFETENTIIPFESVAFIEIGCEKIHVALNKTFTLTSNESYFYIFPKEQLENYKNWLEEK
jgi:hypothetical protein